MAMVFISMVFGCASMDIRSDHDPQANFSNLKTYAWGPETEQKSADLLKTIPMLDSNIKQAVEAELTSRGYQKSPENKADFWVISHADVNEKTQTATIPRHQSYKSRTWQGPVMDDTHVYEYEEGTLILEVVTPGSGQVIWRGIAQAVVEPGRTPAEREARIREAVRQMLAHFPPK
jgi:hypothetical protein